MSKVSDMLDSLRPARDEQGSPVLQGEYDRLKQQLAAKDAELEVERLRLAACGVVALANTRDSANKARSMDPQYRSASLGDVERAVDAEMDYREQLAAKQARIDELMLEYCPNEMTEEQLEEWSKHQRAVKESK